VFGGHVGSGSSVRQRKESIGAASRALRQVAPAALRRPLRRVDGSCG
jgi:hypothetical protein